MYISLKLFLLWICLSIFLSYVESFRLRLIDGKGPNTGRLEAEIEESWVRISIPPSGKNIAKVACRVLGYSGYSAVIMTGKYMRQPWNQGVLRSVKCTGDEVSLRNCTYSRAPRRFPDPYRGATIICLNITKDQIALRLADGASPNSGRLQVNLTGDWQTLCSSDFNPSVVKVVCRNIGFSGVSRILGAAPRTTYNGIQLGSMRCDGTESYLWECAGDSIRTTLCRYNSVDIVCTNQTTETVPLRLVEGLRSNSGILEMELDGTWARLCPNNFHPNEASVACRTMGYSGFASLISITAEDPVNDTFWLYGWDCAGTETHLLDCSYHEKRKPMGWCGRPAAITCANNSVDDFTERLTDLITPDSGRLEIQIGGVWGTVCNHGFNIKAANVACRHLGYSGADGMKGVMQEQSRLSAIPVWISHVDCTGSEPDLSHCSYDQASTISCNHYDDVAIRCRKGNKWDFAVRLADGTSGNNGRLEMLAEGVYGTVCRNKFGETEGNVACRNLGYWKFHRFIQLNSTITPQSVPVWLDDVKCDGSETRLIECVHNGLGIHSCSHDDDVAIKCLEKDAVAVRLRNGIKSNTGRLEIRIDGIWGTVCNHKFDYRDATVACRMLGFNGAYAIMDQQNYVRSDIVLSIWLDNLNCTGSESHLLDCRHKGIGVHQCKHSDDVGLKCLPNDPVSPTTARLVDGLTPHSGRLELQIDGVWGSVCRQGFTRANAAVACRMLGYTGTPIALATKPPARAPRSPLWMYDVQCNGSESTLIDCPHEITPPENVDIADKCSYLDDISIMCLSPEQVESVSVRFVNGSAHNEGRIEIHLDGVWGLMVNNLDENFATVACRMLGYAGSSEVLSSLYMIDTHGRTVMNRLLLGGLQCTGDETSLLDCNHTINKGFQNRILASHIRCHVMPSGA